MKKITFIVAIIMLFALQTNAQDFLDGIVSGNFQMEAQTYNRDSLIGTKDVPQKLLSNSYLNLVYSTSNFETGLRYEAYYGPMQGFSPELDGQGIAYRYGRFHNDKIDITAGDFYEQFGSGLIFRAYENRQLGYDNAIDGVKIKVNPINGITITGLIGHQRYYWEKLNSTVRGSDISFNLTELFAKDASYNWNIGASMISKFQKDDNPILDLPENVLAYAVRSDFANDFMNAEIEYGLKQNDPSSINNKNYNEGRGLIMAGSFYGMKGFSTSLSYHWIDNMDFRSDRTLTGETPALNYIPSLTKQHAYRLATAYPFGTQLMGETGWQLETTYKLAKKSLLGGKYGTTLTLNYSEVYNVNHIPDEKYPERLFKSDFMSIGDKLLFRDISFDIYKKLSKKIKTHIALVHQDYNKDYCEFENYGHYGMINANIGIVDITYKLPKRHAIRGEFQILLASQDSVLNHPDIIEDETKRDNLNGDWIMVLLEYTLPHFYFTVSSEYNYGNEFIERPLLSLKEKPVLFLKDNSFLYYNIAAGWIEGSTRLQLSYGKQRDGILCVGGVCRAIPATNGFYLSLSSSF